MRKAAAAALSDEEVRLYTRPSEPAHRQPERASHTAADLSNMRSPADGRQQD